VVHEELFGTVYRTDIDATRYAARKRRRYDSASQRRRQARPTLYQSIGFERRTFWSRGCSDKTSVTRAGHPPHHLSDHVVAGVGRSDASRHHHAPQNRRRPQGPRDEQRNRRMLVTTGIQRTAAHESGRPLRRGPATPNLALALSSTERSASPSAAGMGRIECPHVSSDRSGALEPWLPPSREGAHGRRAQTLRSRWQRTVQLPVKSRSPGDSVETGRGAGSSPWQVGEGFQPFVSRVRSALGALRAPLQRLPPGTPRTESVGKTVDRMRQRSRLWSAGEALP
jgi:hypothetical protein